MLSKKTSKGIPIYKDKDVINSKSDFNAAMEKIDTLVGGGGGGAVDSVNGMTGDVVLKAEDIEDTKGDTIQDDLNTLEPLFITATSHTTIDGVEVPELTKAQVEEAYTGLQAGKNVIIIDDGDTINSTVFEACDITTEKAIRLIFKDKFVLTYVINVDDVDITSVKLDVSVDNDTIEINASGNISLKDLGHDASKLKDSAIGGGLEKSSDGKTIQHSNSITAQTTEKLSKLKYDAQGHITDSSEVQVKTSMAATDTDDDLYSAKNIFYQLTNRQFNIHIGGSPLNVFSRDGWLKYIENNFAAFHKYNEIFTATGQFTTGEAPESGLFFFMEISRRADMGMIRATNPNTGNIFVSYTTDGTTWSAWEPMLKGNLATSISSASTDAEVPSAKAVWTEAEKRVRDLGSIGTNKTRDDLVSVISKNNNESYIGWCNFTIDESPTSDTASYTLLVNCPIKANPYITIQATNCNTGEIFVTKNTGSGWLDWKFVPVFDTKIYDALTRNAVANMLTHNGEISFLGRFASGEHPQSGYILKITVNLMIDTTSSIKYYSIKTYRYSTNQTWTTIANGTGTTFTWGEWVNETISGKLNISEVLTGTKTRAEIFTATGNQSTKIFSTVYFASTDLPPGATTGTSFTVIAGTNSSGTYGTIQALHQGNGDFFICSCNSGTWSAWKKIAKTDISGSITSGTGFTISMININKVDKHCDLSFEVTTANALNDGTLYTIGTVSTDLKPVGDVVGAMWNAKSGSTTRYFIAGGAGLNRSGTLYIQLPLNYSMSASDKTFINFSYELSN